MSMPISGAIELAPLQYQQPLVDTLETFKITNPVEFLATVYYESKYLTNLVENLNYSTDALLKKFSRRRISYEEALKHGRNSRHPANQEAIANCIYGGKWGLEHLGNHLPGDGWHFRGQGSIQLTGSWNWQEFGKYLERPDIAINPIIAIRDPLLTCYTAGWFWSELKNINRCGDDMRAITKLVTGASDTAIKTRVAYRERILSLQELA